MKYQIVKDMYELSIKEDIVQYYNKYAAQIISLMNLGNVNNELLALEYSAKDRPQQCVATHLLVFMVHSLFT